VSTHQLMNSQQALIDIIRYAKSYRPRIVVATVYSIINKLFDIAPEILIGMAIDVVVSKEKSFLSNFGLLEPWHQILALGVLTFFIWAGESLFEYLLLINWRNLAQNIQHDLRLDAYNHIQNLDLSYFEDQSTGNLVAIMNDDVNQLERFLDGGANNLIQTFTAVIGVGAVFFYLSPLIALIAITPIPVIILGAFYFQKRALPLYKNVRASVGHLSSRLSNNISGIMTIKSFTSEAAESEQLRTQSLDYVEANRKAIAVSSAFIPIIRMAILSGFLATFIIGGYKVLQGDMPVGSYGVLVFLTQRLLWPLTSLAQNVDLYERAMASTRRILDILKQPLIIQSGSLETSNLEGHYQFKNAYFKYNSGDLVLKDLNLAIEPKKTTAFVGSTGSGKSTLVKLLLRFYDLTEGELCLDGHKIKDYNLKFLRSQVGLVSQDVFLFHGTVKENIAYGNPGATEEAIKKAAQMAEAMSFIEALPEGLNTIIGERGQKLSGGQRQRLSIARAILKDPKILILDEATSAVDNETEAAIQRSLKVISQNRTTIIIAHRLSTIVHADQIFVLDHGQVIESGRHEELLKQGQTYTQLWKVQTGS
jgi:ATP-binding cassette subfamily B protein